MNETYFLNIFMVLLVFGGVYLLASILFKDSEYLKMYSIKVVFMGGIIALLAVLPIIL